MNGVQRPRMDCLELFEAVYPGSRWARRLQWSPMSVSQLCLYKALGRMQKTANYIGWAVKLIGNVHRFSIVNSLARRWDNGNDVLLLAP